MQTTSDIDKISRFSLPDKDGHFGDYGGIYVPETLMTALYALREAYEDARKDDAFENELAFHLREYAGRATPLYHAERLSAELGGAKIYIKREDLLHTGAHKINNVLGQILLARRMGKKRIIAETGAGQHGVATAAACAKFGLECVIYMGAIDMERQALNVFRMRLCGAEVRAVTAGQQTLKEAINEAIRDWVTNVRTSHYLLGSALGPHPYPMINRDFQRVIGQETREQILEKEGRLPNLLIACVGGGSNAIGFFFDFLEDEGVELIGIEAGGHGLNAGEHAARFEGGKIGILHGCKTYVLQNPDGQIELTHSVSAGLDYPSISPEHAFYRDRGRISYGFATDDEALEAFQQLSKHEGIIPALESSHAVAYALKRAPQMNPKDIMIINMSGRGDKDVDQAEKILSGSEEGKR